MVKTAIVVEPYDSADFLKTPEALAAYLADVLESNDPALIAHAIGVAARAHGMADIAKKTKLSRESLYRTLSAEGNPELETMVKVLTELGLRLSIVAEAKVQGSQRATVVRREAVSGRYTVAGSSKWGSAHPKGPSNPAKLLTAAGLTQKGKSERTSAKVATSAAKILSSKTASKAAKSTAASSLTQAVKKK